MSKSEFLLRKQIIAVLGDEIGRNKRIDEKALHAPIGKKMFERHTFPMHDRMCNAPHNEAQKRKTQKQVCLVMQSGRFHPAQPGRKRFSAKQSDQERWKNHEPQSHNCGVYALFETIQQFDKGVKGGPQHNEHRWQFVREQRTECNTETGL